MLAGSLCLLVISTDPQGSLYCSGAAELPRQMLVLAELLPECYIWKRVTM